MTKQIFISSDHGGFTLKEKICEYLLSKKYFIKNLGPSELITVDYPDFAALLANEILKEKNSFGMLFCGTGIGISIAANRFSHIRAALCTDVIMALLSRKHNNANVLTMPARHLEWNEVKEIIDVFLSSEFEGGRHQRRVNKISI